MRTVKRLVSLSTVVSLKKLQDVKQTVCLMTRIPARVMDALLTPSMKFANPSKAAISSRRNSFVRGPSLASGLKSQLAFQTTATTMVVEVPSTQVEVPSTQVEVEAPVISVPVDLEVNPASVDGTMRLIRVMKKIIANGKAQHHLHAAIIPKVVENPALA